MINISEINKQYQNLVIKGSIKENDIGVINRISLMFNKAQNNLKIARTIFNISINTELKEILKLKESDSFFDWTIQAAYYSMFHAVNALLATKKIKITLIETHRATLYAFGKHFILNKELAEELFIMYGETEEKAIALFSSLAEEKKKRGFSAYERLSKMNIEPAKESLENAQEFVKTIGEILTKNKYL